MLSIPTTTDLGPHQFDICQLNKTLLILSITYLVFAATLVPIRWLPFFGLSENTEILIYDVALNWHIWAYAVNVLVYIATMQDFPKIYKLFLTDAKDTIVSCVREVYSKATSPAGETTYL